MALPASSLSPGLSLKRVTAGAAVSAAVLFGVLACGATPAAGPETGATATSPTSTPTAGSFPVTVTNCGNTLTFTEAPHRVVLLKSASVPYLAGLGVLNDVVTKAGQYPSEYYDDATNAALAKIPTLTDKLDPSGHLQISKEVVLEQEPDLVLGQTDTVNAKSLANTGVPLMEAPAFCGDTSEPPGFDAVYKEFTMYGKVFGREKEAAAAVEKLKSGVDEVTQRIPDRHGKTGAALYPTIGGGTTYAYGNQSMADPQLKLAGFTNVFGDVDQRVFEVSVEQLLAKDPDVIVLLYSEGSADQVTKELKSLPGADRLKAVKNGHVMAHLLNFTEPPSPLALTGLQSIEKTFADVK